MRNINIGDNQIPQPEPYNPEPLPPVNNNELEKPKSNKQALLYLLAIPFIIGAILLGNYLLNKSNSFFMDKRNKMVQSQIDEHSKKKEEKKDEEKYYLEVPMRTITGTRFVLEYNTLKEKPTNVKHLEHTTEINEHTKYYYDQFNFGLVNYKKGFFIQSTLFTIDESNNTMPDDTGRIILEKEDNYLYTQYDEGKYFLFLLIEKEDSEESNIKYYHGIIIDRLYDVKELENSRYLIDSDYSKSLEELKNIKKDFEKEYTLYYCADKEGNFDSCKDKNNNSIHKDNYIDINDL